MVIPHSGHLDTSVQHVLHRGRCPQGTSRIFASLWKHSLHRSVINEGRPMDLLEPLKNRMFKCESTVDIIFHRSRTEVPSHKLCFRNRNTHFVSYFIFTKSCTRDHHLGTTAMVHGLRQWNASCRAARPTRTWEQKLGLLKQRWGLWPCGEHPAYNSLHRRYWSSCPCQQW